MARGTYRTGAKRDRRKRDTGGVPVPTPGMIPYTAQVDSADDTEVVVLLQMKSWATGLDLEAEDWKLTGLASGIVFKTPAGVFVPVTTLTAVAPPLVQVTVNGSWGVGSGLLIVRPWDAAIRGADGAWLGPGVVDVNVT